VLSLHLTEYRYFARITLYAEKLHIFDTNLLAKRWTVLSTF